MHCHRNSTNTTMVSFNTAGTGGAEMMIKIAGQIAVTAADFVL
jgi:hypothetical protein